MKKNPLLLCRGGTCCTGPHVTWRPLEVLWESCSLISPVPSNTVKPLLLKGKMEDEQLVTWTNDNLSSRSQFVGLQDCASEVVVCTTGAPQGTMLSPFMFTAHIGLQTPL